MNIFTSNLAHLVSPHKEKILHLTKLADNNKRMAPAIICAIQTHLMNVENKLTVLYLIDSICKQVRDPFVSLFNNIIAGIFRYTCACNVDKQKLKPLFQSWSSIFCAEVLQQMRYELYQMPHLFSDCENTTIAYFLLSHLQDSIARENEPLDSVQNNMELAMREIKSKRHAKPVVSVLDDVIKKCRTYIAKQKTILSLREHTMVESKEEEEFAWYPTPHDWILQ